MYIPPPFAQTDPDALADVITAHSFATLITTADGLPFASHLPLLFDRERGVLRGHLARANPQSEHLRAGQEALAIFLGPHAYISPTWYATRPAVPTWNYVTVHAYGTPRLLDDAGTAALLDELVATYEASQPAPWDGVLPADLAAKLRAAVVAFELDITRLEGKFKLGQNRSEADQAGVAAALSGTALGEWLRPR